MSTELFGNRREANLISTVALVEEALAELGVPGSRAAEAGALHAWRFATGSAVTRVTLLDGPAAPHLRISAVVMTIPAAETPPERRLALYQELLERNHALCGAAFAVDGDRVLLVAERSTLDLDRSELLDGLRRVAGYADAHDDALVARFGGRLGEG